MELNPNVQIPTFKMTFKTQLFEFIDHLVDIECFVYVNNIILHYKLSTSIFINYRLCLGFKEIPRHMPHSEKAG